MSDPPVDACSICGAGPVEKLLFPVAVHFKGSGFYSTDYGKSARKPAKETGDAGGGDKSAKGTPEKASSDTKKPAADAG